MAGTYPEGDDGPVPPPTEIVPVRRPAPIEVADRQIRLILSSNREFTFGYLLGYLSLALHSTLQYPKYLGFFVGPWIEPEGGPLEPLVRVWGRTVSRRSSYAPVAEMGRVLVVLSDGIGEPRDTLRRLGVPDRPTEPPTWIAVRTRTPRVDLVIEPASGCAFELHAFAREIGERFRRNLD